MPISFALLLLCRTDTQQHAWLSKQLYRDDELANLLSEFETKVNDFRQTETTRRFLSLSPRWTTIEEVGMPEKEGVADPDRLRDELYEWLVPSNGLEVRTKLQSTIAGGIVVSALIVGGGIIAAGGLGFIGGLLGYGASLTGGYGTASMVVGGGVAGTLLLKKRFRSKYNVMLQDLLQVYTGQIPITKSEMQLEASLLVEEVSFNEKWTNNTLQRTNIPMYDEYNQDSQRKFRRMVAMVSYIHKMKAMRARTSLVAICGPRDSGKTTLLSQLLHRPEIAAHGTGYTGGEAETVTVTPYQVPRVHGYAILDTPGLTGPDAKLRNKFTGAALNLASTFVYVREYMGLPTEIDVKTIQQILQCAARCKNPSILVCLNRCKEKLTEDAAGEIFHLRAETEASKWLATLDSLRSKYSAMMPSWVNRLWSGCRIEVRFVELKGGIEFEAELSRDERTRGIWTASSIGLWIAQNVIGPDPNENGRALQDHFRSFEYPAWQMGYRQELERVRRAAEVERINNSIGSF
jgi:hypothetical protein